MSRVGGGDSGANRQRITTGFFPRNGAKSALFTYGTQIKYVAPVLLHHFSPDAPVKTGIPDFSFELNAAKTPRRKRQVLYK